MAAETSDPVAAELLEVALAAARAGAAVIREHGLMTPGGARRAKSTGDYVTAVDEASEAAILEELARRTPEIPVLAEERGGAAGGRRWAVDPLDGTTNFTRGLPAVAVSVGLLEGRRPVLGCVLAPFLGLEFATAGEGVRRNGERLPRLAAGDVATAIVATGFPFRRRERMERYRPALLGALAAFEDLRRPGAAALDLAWTAAGTFDGFFELGLGTWDVAAGAALVLAAGGAVTDWEGGDAYTETGDVIAAAPAVHARLLEIAAR